MSSSCPNANESSAAPGFAPVFDPCGVAGGHRPPDGPFGGIYVNTSHARIGDYGTQVLPASPPGEATVWRAGAAVEVRCGVVERGAVRSADDCRPPARMPHACTKTNSLCGSYDTQ